jgi:hypothetical protein
VDLPVTKHSSRVHNQQETQLSNQISRKIHILKSCIQDRPRLFDGIEGNLHHTTLLETFHIFWCIAGERTVTARNSRFPEF